MAYQNKHKSQVCSLCGVGKILSGPQSTYNGRVDGKIACLDCVIKDRIIRAVEDLNEA